MATVAQFLFLDFDNMDSESNVYANANQAGALTLEIQLESGSTVTDLSPDDIRIYGSVDMKDENFTPIKAVFLKNFKTTEQLKTQGIYLVLTEGVSYVKIVRTASPSIPIKAFANACA